MIEILANGASLAGEIVARTSSTARVQSMLQLSLAPVFLLAAIGAFLNVMNGRLIWLTERLDRLDQCEANGVADPALDELPVLQRRRKYAHRAVDLSTSAALIICFIVALMFVSAFVRPAMGTFVAAAWVLAMAMVFTALLFFLLETRLAAASSAERKRMSREIRKKDGQSESPRD